MWGPVVRGQVKEGRKGGCAEPDCLSDLLHVVELVA